MGCFNETCAISNVHIGYGDDVAVILLQADDRSYESYCYPNAYYDIAPLMFYGKYNDYGSVEDILETTSLGILLEHIKEDLVEVPQGENTAHDVPVVRKDFNMEMLLEACWENRMLVGKSSFSSKGMPLRYAYIHKTVLDAILTEYTADGYGRDVKGNFRHYTYTFATVQKDIPEYVRRLRAKLIEMSKADKSDFAMFRTISREDFDLFAESKLINFAAKFMSFARGDGASRVIFSPTEFLCEHGLNLTEDDTIEFITELLKVRWINHFMHASNKVWIKPMSAGQDRDWRPFELLNKAVAKVISDDSKDEDEEMLSQDKEYHYGIKLEDNPNFLYELMK
jgi:hypothetical protein